MPGRYFDEWKVGDRIAHSVTRTVTETDNVLISALTHNPQPMHLDHEAAAASEFGKPLVNSVFTFGLMIGVSVADTTLGTLVANLGYDALKFPNPVFAGDIDRMFVSLVPPGYDASEAMLAAPATGWAEISGIACDGSGSVLAIGMRWCPSIGCGSRPAMTNSTT